MPSSSMSYPHRRRVLDTTYEPECEPESEPRTHNQPYHRGRYPAVEYHYPAGHHSTVSPQRISNPIGSPVQRSISTTDTSLSIHPPAVTMQPDLEEGTAPSTPTVENASIATNWMSFVMNGATNLSTFFIFNHGSWRFQTRHKFSTGWNVICFVALFHSFTSQSCVNVAKPSVDRCGSLFSRVTRSLFPLTHAYLTHGDSGVGWIKKWPTKWLGTPRDARRFWNLRFKSDVDLEIFFIRNIKHNIIIDKF